MRTHSSSCTGFRSQTEAVLTLHLNGLSCHQIADRTALPTHQVHSLLTQAKTRRKHRKRLEEHAWSDAMGDIAPAAKETLRCQAALRDLTVEDFAALIVETVACAGLIDAVLDDGDRPKVARHTSRKDFA
ncbi:hypothetical protein FP2506_11547 [Fulvimarina pelagi HTCC2506]|uniref:Uncharacterized protein n=1 Tax=Fulvimarina pelagi HTCC2506 TaxID=314231 RepID=Q0FYX0_9HYPH|nr:hypothetical protein [Fulvimarina pelagi]EAU40188.1 hypothetical protein FP2506_11547 [Fulvimarina pelagi HTCC2506]